MKHFLLDQEEVRPTGPHDEALLSKLHSSAVLPLQSRQNICEGDKNVATLKLLFGILILSDLLKNKIHTEALHLPSPLFLPKRFKRNLLQEGNVRVFSLA